MPTILITGFEPFNGFTVNPSEVVVKSLDGSKIDQFDLVGLVLPLDYKNAFTILEKALVEHKPEYVLCCGQANRAAISIERIAVNAVSTKRSDNYENTPESDTINTEGPAAYFANLDPLPLVQTLLDNDIPAYVSYHAGLYGCNWLLYKVMQMIETGLLHAKATFIHLPPLPFQAIEKDLMNLATMPLEIQINALKTIIASLS
ncbi:MAG: pyroglutamyl-peptidase I family protein [Candidatus Thorarchaeota archaeon]